MNPSVLILGFFSFFLVTVQLWLYRREIIYQRRCRKPLSSQQGDRPDQPATLVDAGYSVARLQAGAAGVLLDGAFLLFWTLGGGATMMLDSLWFAALADNSAEILVLVSVVLVQAVFHRLLTAYRQFGVERKFGFQRMSAGLFVRDTFLYGSILTVVAGLLAWVCVGFLEALGGSGWVAVWLIWVAFSWARSWLYPVVVAPLFDHFSTLDDTDLCHRIGTLMSHVGGGLSKVQVMDGSRRSSHANARVIGLGSTRKVVLQDTLLDALSSDEVVAVLAHEVGHIKHAHITRYQGFLAALALLWIVGSGLFLTTTQVFLNSGPGNPGAGVYLATVWLATPVFGIIARPLISWLIRAFEYQADAFVIDHDDPAALCSALVKLHARNGSTEGSDTLFGFVYLSHPSLQDRMTGLVPGKTG